ncbi:MAG: SDR family oxidoreductase [Alphaproteobacteria bacterium]
MAGRLDGKVAIVTGAGAGFGEAIARAYAAEGAAVIVNDVGDAEGVAEAITAAGGKARYVGGDVSKDKDVARLVAEAQSAFGGLDIFFSNAGVAQAGDRLEETDEATFDRLFEVNVKGIYWAAKHAVPVFKAQKRGCFINTASTAGLRPRPRGAWYAASKGAVVTLTKAMALELAPHGIRVNAILPVAAETKLMIDSVGGDLTDQIRDTMVGTIPLGRFATPTDIASAAVFLASDEAAFLTGVNLPVDGGRTA